ncbi:MAG: transcriptional regulator [Candidatus Saccharibacteria bacterium]
MNTSQSITNDTQSPSLKLGQAIRSSRKACGWTIAQMAEQIGRPREWLNRIELGHSEYGEHKPANQSDLTSIASVLGEALDIDTEEFLSLGKAAEASFDSLRRNKRGGTYSPAGKFTQAEVIIGEEQIGKAIVDLIKEQHSDAIIRNTGVKGPGSYNAVSSSWKQYREALGDFLAKNPNALFKRVEFAANPKHLQHGKEADERLAGGRDMSNVHNAKIKFQKQNPLQLHVLIGQREAIIALPQTGGQAGSNMALLVRDKLFVEALRVWYDEILWEGSGDSRTVSFSDFDGSFDQIRNMYGF